MKSKIGDIKLLNFKIHYTGVEIKAVLYWHTYMNGTEKRAHNKSMKLYVQ
jgi:hypothetical protein